MEQIPYDKDNGLVCPPGKQNDKVFSCEYIPPINEARDVECKGKVEEVFTLEDLEKKPNAFIMAMALPTRKLAEFENLAYYFPYVNEEEMNCGVGGSVDVGGTDDDVVADDNRM
jgi:hypothetical protein